MKEFLPQFHYQAGDIKKKGLCFSFLFESYLFVRIIDFLSYQIHQHSNTYIYFRISGNKTTDYPNCPMHFLNKIPRPCIPFTHALKECETKSKILHRSGYPLY